jgi:hypothetical protein
MAGPVLKILYNGDEIQEHVLYESCTFESQMAAIPGTFSMTLKDPLQELDFTTGKRIEVLLDDLPLWGGFVTVVGRQFAFPVVDTVNRDPGDVKERFWVLQGVDYNILFDKLVLRRVEDYLHAIPNGAVGLYDYMLVSTLVASYLDVPSWLTLNVDQTAIRNPTDVYVWRAQGSPWRDSMTDIAMLDGQIWYIDAAGTLQWHAVESGGSAWGFSDVPDGETYIGFRELEASEDGAGMVNDALVFGGDDATGGNPGGLGDMGGTVAYRYQNTDSQTEHGRWQYAEVHFGDPNFAETELVQMRAERIVDGPTGSSALFETSGLKQPAWNIRLVWFDNDVPPGATFLQPGYYVNMVFNVLGEGGAPLELTLPCRTITMTFPVLQPDPDDPSTSAPAVRFEGQFAIELNDRQTLWQAILNARDRIEYRPRVLTVTDDSSEAQYNAAGQFIPTPDADGTATVFTLKFGYLRGTTHVYVDGLRQSMGLTPGQNDYQETDPVAGEITFSSPPGSGAKLFVEASTRDGTA